MTPRPARPTKTPGQLSHLHLTRSDCGYRGVEWRRDRGVYRARIGSRTKRRWLGSFNTAEEAAREYDQEARHEYGAAAALNFPRPGERGIVPAKTRRRR